MQIKTIVTELFLGKPLAILSTLVELNRRIIAHVYQHECKCIRLSHWSCHD